MGKGCGCPLSRQQKKLLVVDDIPINRLILADLFQEEYEVLEAENGQQALELILQHREQIAIVLLDIVMPVMDGFQVLERMAKLDLIQTIPVIMITGESDDEKTLMGYALGVSDIISKPFNPKIVSRRVNNVVKLYSHRQELERELQKQKEMLEQQARRIHQSSQFVIDALSTTVEFRNMESGEHILRVRTLTRIFLEEMREFYSLTDEQIKTIANVSAMHDIGKIVISDAILLKPGPLTEEEFEIMKTHTIRGCEILDTLNYTQDEESYRYSYDICRHHHERWDGRGYPDGLKGDEISIWAQATSLADVYDALTSERVYKQAYSHEETIRMILNGECGAFNPRLLDMLVRVEGTLQEKIFRYTQQEKNEMRLSLNHRMDNPGNSSYMQISMTRGSHQKKQTG
ncbi:MAG TPA: response regulator [Clostridiales bacterium]|nr:response regulator [Clostridiales bacterium]